MESTNEIPKPQEESVGSLRSPAGVPAPEASDLNILDRVSQKWDRGSFDFGTSEEFFQAVKRVRASHDALTLALAALLARYVSLANSGDCGNWNAEKEPVVMDARAALGLSTPKGGV